MLGKNCRVKHTRHNEEATLEQLLQEQAAVAYCMAMDGPVYAPIFERYEREIAALLFATTRCPEPGAFWKVTQP